MIARPPRKQGVEAVCMAVARKIEHAHANEEMAATASYQIERDYCLRAAARYYREAFALLAALGAMLLGGVPPAK